ncbi:MAG: pyruvate, phosphate dikinase [Nitrososphaeria archaeon]
MNVYSFKEASELKLTKFELGGKGYGLVEMYRIGIPVPPGFIISTECCRNYFNSGRKLSEELKKEVKEKIRELENDTGKIFGGPENPLLVSVRSGAPFSMPGMMDTILNLGLNDKVVNGLVKITLNPKFVYEIYSRFIHSFCKLVFKIPEQKFDQIYKNIKNTSNFDESSPEFWELLVNSYKIMLKENGIDFPQDPYEQLFNAIATVFESWWNPRAITYRKIYKISDELGTAVTVMQMVYGNYNEKSATGVIFTRNPSNGIKELYGEYLLKAQGEELVSGIKTPKPISELKREMPKIYSQLEEVANKLERYFKDMQDIEFTVEDGKLFILQTRNGKRTPQASIKIAVDMAEEGLISPEEALLRVEPAQIKQMLQKRISSKISVKPIATGLPASPGVAIGKVVFKVEDAVKLKEKNEQVILVRPETAPEDIVGVTASEGLLTTRGGLTSHAAVVARGFGKPCVVGCESIILDLDNEKFLVKDKQVRKGDIITIDGATGNVYHGALPIEEPKISDEVNKILAYSDKIRRLKILGVVSNTETAKKVNLLKPEAFLFMNIEDIFMKQLLNFYKLLESEFNNEQLYKEVLEYTKSKFEIIFNVIEEKPIYLKLVSKPVREMLPLRSLGADELVKKHPQFYFRGVRQMLSLPKFYTMQLEAIFKAAKDVGKKLDLKILVPFITTSKEILMADDMIKSVAREVEFDKSMSMYDVGTIIATPRSLLTFDEIAKYVNFALIDLDEITSSIYGFNRYELRGGIIPFYIKKGILSSNPYEKIEFETIKNLLTTPIKVKENMGKNIEIGVYTSAPITYELIETVNGLNFDYLAVGVDDIILTKITSAKVLLEKFRDKVTYTA